MKLSSNKIKLNFLFVLVIILVIFGSYLFIQKVYTLQFIESDFFENQALSYRQRVEILEAKRGTIYDKNFNVLASSVQSYNVVVKSNEIDDLGFVSVLSSLLNLDEAEILKKINDNSKFCILLQTHIAIEGSQIHPNVNSFIKFLMIRSSSEW